jgi:hypothetical protein
MMVNRSTNETLFINLNVFTLFVIIPLALRLLTFLALRVNEEKKPCQGTDNNYKHGSYFHMLFFWKTGTNQIPKGSRDWLGEFCLQNVRCPLILLALIKYADSKELHDWLFTPRRHGTGREFIVNKQKRWSF